MALTKDSVIWTGKTTGVTMENYKGKYSIKSVRKYMRNDEEVLTYDWIYKEEYDKEQKKRVVASKPVPGSVYLGEYDEAVIALSGFLKELRAKKPVYDSSPSKEEEPPF